MSDTEANKLHRFMETGEEQTFESSNSKPKLGRDGVVTCSQGKAFGARGSVGKETPANPRKTRCLSSPVEPGGKYEGKAGEEFWWPDAYKAVTLKAEYKQ